ncbi:MAG: zinc ribbon domain-containing protein [Candidatus Eisenbacteria bacterium]|nr:zinc ribbon domain-containing protein [Candidatus Eisenbacteria bacterium]
MPTYDYVCTKCGHAFELVQKMSDPPKSRCPECRGKVERKIGSGAGLIFKGSGFYITDYRSKDYKAKEKTDRAATGGASSDSGGAGSSGAGSSGAGSAGGGKAETPTVSVPAKPPTKSTTGGKTKGSGTKDA